MSTEKPEPLTFDKSTWGDGPWQSEPDRIEFEHAGLPCLMLRARNGGWCGYAAVPPSHPWHRKDYSSCLSDPPCGDDAFCYEDTPAGRVTVHGGLTYADACQGHICHVPKPGEPDNVWWFGFDCAHSGDVSPAYDSMWRGTSLESREDSYRDVLYVRAEVERLAEQLARVK